MFKKGDWVECVDNKEYYEKLTIGKAYQVTSVEPEFIDVIGDKGNTTTAYQYRYKPVGGMNFKFEVGDTVRCTGKGDNSGRAWKKGLEFVVEHIQRYSDLTGDVCFRDGYSSGIFQNGLVLVKRGGTMSKYEDLKERIDELECFDEEGFKLFKELAEGNATSFEVKVNWTNCNPRGDKVVFYKTGSIHEDFDFNTPCNGFEAFKKGLYLMLDESSFKKTIVGTEQKIEIDGKVYKAKIVCEE